MNLILIEPRELSADGAAVLTGVRAAHLRDVLRAAPGRTLRVGLVDGPLGVATVCRVDQDAIELACTFEAAPPPRPAVDILLALPRPKVMRRLWAQLAAIGVGRIILTNAERVERNYFDTTVLTPETYRPLLLEGLQQARDTRLPAVTIHRQFKILVEDDLDRLCAAGRRLAADPGAVTAAGEAARARPADRVLLAIGPEGGWNPFELSLLAAHGFEPVGLGARTLRTDTACIALLAVVHEARRTMAVSTDPAG